MCGIIAAFNTAAKIGKESKQAFIKPERANDYIINQYQEQSTRGQKGFGIIRIDSKHKVEIDRACESTKFLLDLYMKDSDMIIAHHRQPTSTENKMGQTHPILVTNDKLEHIYLFVHNGMVANHEELRKKHMELGFQYQTDCYEKAYYNGKPELKWNDTESLAIEVALYIENQSKMIETENGAAFIVLQIDKKTEKAKKVFFGKNGSYSSLKMSKTRGKLRISSEGEGSDVKENILYSFEIKDKTMDLKKRGLLFKVKAPTVVTPVEEPTHSPFCKCEKCSAKKWIKETKDKTPYTLPHKQELLPSPNNDTLNKAEETETLTERPKRSWNLVDNGPEEDEDIPPYIEKGYIGEMAIELKNKLKDATTTEITHIIDDTLDEEMDKISEIVTGYKNALLKDHLETDEEEFFCEQVNKIIETMKVLTNVADNEYKEKGLIEMQEEYEKDQFPNVTRMGFKTSHNEDEWHPRHGGMM